MYFPLTSAILLKKNKETIEEEWFTLNCQLCGEWVQPHIRSNGLFYTSPYFQMPHNKHSDAFFNSCKVILSLCYGSSMLKLAVCRGQEGRYFLNNVFMFNMMQREQCQTSFHRGVLSQYKATASVQIWSPFAIGCHCKTLHLGGRSSTPGGHWLSLTARGSSEPDLPTYRANSFCS